MRIVFIPTNGGDNQPMEHYYQQELIFIIYKQLEVKHLQDGYSL